MLKLKPLIAAKAKENLVTHTKNGYKQLCQNSDNPVDTKKELSKLAGVSHDTISRIEKIVAKAPEEIKTKLRAGELMLKLKPLIAAKAKEKQLSTLTQFAVPQNSAKREQIETL